MKNSNVLSYAMFKVVSNKQVVRWLVVGILVVLIVMGQTNHTMAAPSLQVNTFPYSENFDSFSTCSTNPGAACALTNEWINATNDDIDWTVDNNGTPSGGTGPSADHTTGTTSGKYLYTEASSGRTNKQAHLISPQIDLSGGISHPWVSFWYHMRGANMGTLHVDVSIDDGVSWTNDVIPALTDNQNLWQEAYVNLVPYVGQSQLRIRLRGVTGSDFASDMAIDDFMIYEPAYVVVEPTWENSLTLNEGGIAQTYQISLWTVPAGSVEVTVTADSDSEVSLDGTNFANSQTLPFTDKTSQTITFRAVDDAIIEGVHATTISHAITTTADSADYPLTTTIDTVNASISDNDFDSDGDKIADAYDSAPLDPFLPGAYGSVTYQTTNDNEDNAQTGNSDGDLNACVFNTNVNHPIEFNIFIDKALPQNSAYLSLFVEDVDWPDEVNEVFLNGHSLGNITGEDGLNYSTMFIIPDISWVKWGNNLVQIDVDQLNVGNWCARVNSGQLVTDYQGANADASIRSMSSDTAVYSYSDLVTIDAEVDTNLGSQTTRLELILRNPNGTIINFDTNPAARNWVITGTEDELYQWQFNLPASGINGLWAVTLTVYDEASQLFQDTATVTFAVPDVTALQPTVTSITPNNGDEAKTTAVTIKGTNFGSGTTCTVGGMSLNSPSVANNTTITGSVPATLAPGSYDVVCSNAYGSGTLSNGFTVNDIDIAAVIDLNGADAGSGFAALFTQAASPITIVDSDLSITDADSSTLASATVTLTNFPDGTAESLAVDVTGTSITAVYSNTTGILTLTGPDTLANFAQVLRTTSYANSASPIDQTNRVVAFVVNDGAVNSNTANSIITIGTPVANEDDFTVAEDGTLNDDVLVNDVDGNGEILTAVLDTTSNGTLDLLSDGTFTYTPDENVCGSDSFTYHANDGTDDSNIATVTIDVTCENDAPIANPDSYDALEDAQLVISAPGILDNDSDVEDDALTAVIDTPPSSGTFSLDSTGTFTYTPALDATGIVTFTYHAHDGEDDSDTAVVTINIQPDTDSDGIPNDSDPDDDNDGQSDIDETSCGSDPLDENSLAADNDGDNSPDCVDADDDNDGTDDTDDAFPFDDSEDTDTDGDGTGNNADTDDDNDGQSDADESSCGSDPLDENSLADDNDSDNIPDCADDDDDNDGTIDINDAFPFDPTETNDNDGDGTGDNADSDDDNDGTLDDDDAFPFDPTEDNDNDNDGTGDNADTDDDNDGTLDDDDAFPFDPTETNDNDGDGQGDNADTDDDNDGQSDADESTCGSDPLDENSLSADNDGDNSPDCADDDDDNDGIIDDDDAFPFDPTETSDNDGDGQGDNADSDDDNDGQSDADENSCGSDPLDENSLSADNDSDNIPDCADDDDDNDGTIDDDDAFPFDPTETSDNDGDGQGDNADSDDDNDGQSDADENNCGSDPLDENSLSADNDSDNIPDCADDDDDNDGTIDDDDAFPFDDSETSDNDGDGQGDNADTDDDNDGQSDADENSCGSDPLDENSLAADNDSDSIPDCADDDDDNDGTIDDDDAFPFDDSETSDNDGDGQGDNADTDDDNDGQSDADENSCGSDSLDENSLSADNDNDGSPDCVDADDDNDGTDDEDDAFPFDDSETNDNDGDGQGDNADPDDDNDGVLDDDDAFPLDPTESNDNDGDGQGDNADTDDDNDLQLDVDEDACGSDSLDEESLSPDYDGDHVPDCVDDDDDNDGTIDDDDAFPFDDTEDTDSDGDGVGDNADDDDDDDGQLDADELTCGSDPLDDNDLALDTDGDDLPDCVDDDDDNDGTVDDDDAFPLDDTEDTDSDGDGQGDNADPDDDNDGLTDVEECPNSVCSDSDGDEILDYLDNDDDGDGLLTIDECGGLPCADSDNDNVPDYLEPNDQDTDDDDTFDHLDNDDDGDGILTADECPNGVPCPDSDGDKIPDYLDHNSAPLAAEDTPSVNEDGSVLIDVLGNDSDPNEDAFTLQSITQPAHGTAVIQGTSIRYTPDANYFGDDTFTYTIKDDVLSSVGTVNVTVNSVNDLPVARNDQATTKKNTAVTIAVLNNDADPIEGSALTVTAVADPAHGQATTNGTTITYIPDNGFSGTETFTYTISDGTDTVAATITVTVEEGGFFVFLPMVIK